VLYTLFGDPALRIRRTSVAATSEYAPGQRGLERISIFSTPVRGVLRLDSNRGPATTGRGELLDASARIVLKLHPGANDVSRLAPGVYFVKAPGTGDRGPAIRKVVLTD
jgi:hypothetical protein